MNNDDCRQLTEDEKLTSFLNNNPTKIAKFLLKAFLVRLGRIYHITKTCPYNTYGFFEL